MQLTLVAKKGETNDTTSFIFESAAPLTWRAGQFLRYALPHADPDDRQTSRYFTVASAPFEGVVMLTTRFMREGGSSFKRALQDISPGARVEVGQPAGDFVVDDPSAEYVFIAGGIGITPYRAILLDLDHRGLPINATLLYANRSAEFVYQGEIDAVASRHPRLRMRYFVAPERITEEAIRTAARDLRTRVFYISGPEPMVEALERTLAEMGVPDAHVKRDYFPGYDWP
ncbi:MAG: ferredoxin--NADP reductase [Candidatus Rokuibacteriota bacterium]